MTKILILGAGITGTSLAYVLAKRGHEVVVLDRQEGNSQECSFANGGQLSYSHVDPWACPEILPKAIAWLGKKDAPLILRMRLDPAMWRWILQFLRYTLPGKNKQGMRQMLRLAHYSQEMMQAILDTMGGGFDYQQTGILRLFATKPSLEKGIKAAKFQEPFGYPFEVLGPQALLAKEPALVASQMVYAGAIYFPQDAIGDAQQFSAKLAEESRSAVFHYQTQILGFETEGCRIKAVVTDRGNFVADSYVLALGADSPLLLNTIGVRLPIYPLKGYSVSVPAVEGANTPRMSVTDMERKIVCTRLGNILRVAGTAELTGYDTSHTDYRIAPLLRWVKEVFPYSADFNHASHWACLRPSTPDGIPILGESPYENLLLNTGHGSLGWTLAAGSAYLLADMIEKRQTAIDLTGFTLDRFI